MNLARQLKHNQLAIISRVLVLAAPGPMNALRRAAGCAAALMLQDLATLMPTKAHISDDVLLSAWDT